MNYKRAAIALVVGFVFVFGFEFVWHGMLMKSAYMQTASLWRSDPEFMSRFGILLLGQVAMTFAFIGLYVSKVGMQGAGRGLACGILFGILVAGDALIRYATEPLTTRILALWIVGGFVEFGLLGALVGALYKSKAA